MVHPAFNAIVTARISFNNCKNDKEVYWNMENKNALITLRSNTAAIHAARVLGSNGIRAHVVALPLELSKNGCSYGIDIDGTSLSNAVHILRVSDINYGRIIR